MTIVETNVWGKSRSFNLATKVHGTFANEDMPFLMEIYNSLDELDGLFNIERLCMSTHLQDKLLIKAIRNLVTR